MKKHLRVFAATLLLALGAYRAQAQDASENEARALLDKVIRANGGAQRIKGIYSYRQKMQLQLQGTKGLESYSWDLFVALPDRVHLETVNAAGQKFTLIVSPSGAVGIAGPQTTDMPGFWSTNWLNSLRRTVFYLSKHLDDGSVRVSLAGSETVAGTMTKIMEINIGGDVSRAWVDPQALRTLRFSAQSQTDKGPKTQTVELSDFRRADGLLQAFHVVLFEDGRQIGTNNIQAVEFNPPVDPRLFYRQPLMLDQVAFSPAAASPAAQVLSGTLQIASQPHGAQLYLDDVPKGMTSESEGRLVLEEVAAGRHRVRLTAAGFKEWNKTLTVEAGDSVAVDAALERAGPPPFSESDVEQMLRGGVASKRVAVLVKERGVEFAMDDAAERRLRVAGADSDLLLAIAKAKR